MPQETVIVDIAFKGKKRAYKPHTTSILKKRLTKIKRPVKRRIKRSTLVHKLDAVFSEWVRLSHAKDGVVKCYTCPTTNEVKKMQNGHYVSRSVRSLRWNEDNCRPQCYGCNVMHGGQPITFRENLIKELGETEVSALEAKRHGLFTPKEEWLQERITFYTQAVSSLREHVL